jgi:hypothetical protein
VPQTNDKLKKILLTKDQAANTTIAGSAALGTAAISKLVGPHTDFGAKAKARLQREDMQRKSMLREMDKIDADMKARLKQNQAEYDKLNIPKTPQEAKQRNWEETSASRKQFYEADRALETELAKNEGRKPKLSRAPSLNQVQARAARNSIVEPVANAASSAVTSASGSFINSPMAKGVGVAGAMLASQKGAGQSPSVEKAYVDDWNKRTNYGRIQGPTSKAMGVVNVKPGSK